MDNVSMLSMEMQVIYRIGEGVNTRKKLWDTFNEFSKAASGKAVNNLIRHELLEESKYLLCPHCGETIEGVEGESHSLLLTNSGKEQLSNIKKMLGAI